MLECFLLLILFNYRVTETHSESTITRHSIVSPLTDELLKFINHLDDSIIGFHLVVPKNDRLFDSSLEKPSSNLKNVLEYVNQIKNLRNMMEKDSDTNMKKRKNFGFKRKSSDSANDHHNDLFLFAEPINSVVSNVSCDPNDSQVTVPCLVRTKDVIPNATHIDSSPKEFHTSIKLNEEIKNDSIYPVIFLNQEGKYLNFTPKGRNNEDVCFLERFFREVNNKDQDEGFSVFPCFNLSKNPLKETSFLILRNNIWDCVKGVSNSNASTLTAFLTPSSNFTQSVSVDDMLALSDPERQLENFYKFIHFGQSSDGIEPLRSTTRCNGNYLVVRSVDRNQSLTSHASGNISQTDSAQKHFDTRNDSNTLMFDPFSINCKSPTNLNWINLKAHCNENKGNYVNNSFSKKINDILLLAKSTVPNFKSKYFNKKFKRKCIPGCMDRRLDTVRTDEKVTVKFHLMNPFDYESNKKNKNHMNKKRIKRDYTTRCLSRQEQNSTACMPLFVNGTAKLGINHSNSKDLISPLDTFINKSNKSSSHYHLLPSQKKNINLLITCPLQSKYASNNPIRKKYSRPKLGLISKNLPSNIDNGFYRKNNSSQLASNLECGFNHLSNSSIFTYGKNSKNFDKFAPKSDSNPNHGKYNFHKKMKPPQNYFKRIPYSFKNSQPNVSTEVRSQTSSLTFSASLLSNSSKNPKILLNSPIKLENVNRLLNKLTESDVKQFNARPNGDPLADSAKQIRSKATNNSGNPSFKHSSDPLANLETAMGSEATNNSDKPTLNTTDLLVNLAKYFEPKALTRIISDFTEVNGGVMTSNPTRNVFVQPTESATSQYSISLAKTLPAHSNTTSLPLVKLVTESSLETKLLSEHKIGTSENYALTSNGSILVNNCSLHDRHNYSLLLGKSKLELLQMPSGEIIQFFDSSSENPLFSNKVTSEETSSPYLLNLSSPEINLGETQPMLVTSSKQPELSTNQIAPFTTQNQPTYNYYQTYCWDNAYNYYGQHPYYNANNYNYYNTFKPAPLMNMDHCTTEVTTSAPDQKEELEQHEENSDYFNDFSPVISVNIFPVIQNWKKPHKGGLALVKELFRSSPTSLNYKEPEKLPNYLSELFDILEESSQKKKIKFDDKVQRKLETILSGKYSLNDVYKYKLQHILQSKHGGINFSDKIS